MATFQTLSSTCLAVSLATAMVMAQDPTPVDSAAPEPTKAAKPSPDELKDKQLDVSLETRDIERVLGKLKRASDLAKQRITDAAISAESVTSSLNKGDSKAARGEAQETTEKLKEIIKQLEALLKEETPQQIAEAKQLAKELAKLEREFAEKFEGALNPPQATGKGKVDPKSEVKPMMDPDLKGEGGANKQGKKPTEPTGIGKRSKGSEKPSPQGAQGSQQTDPKTGSKPMPEGQGGENPDNEKKPGTGTDSNQGDTKDGDANKPNGGPGAEPKPMNPGDGNDRGKKETNEGDEKKPGGGGSSKDKRDDTKPEEGTEGSGDVVPKGISRNGSGPGTDDESATDNDRTEQTNAAAMTPAERREAVARSAEKLAETGKTLQDVLNAIARSTDPDDQDAAEKIQAVLKEIDINKLTEQMNAAGGMIRSRKDADAKLSSVDAAERLEIMVQRLDATYRSVIAPQAEELRKLEAMLAELKEKLEQLETPSQVIAWHREMREVTDQLDKLGVSAEARDLLEKEMKLAGFSVDRDQTRLEVTWALVNNRYSVPDAYNTALIHLQEDVQVRIQTLILGDMGNFSDDATPPKYQELVDRYYELLSKSGKPQSSSPKLPAVPKPKSKAISK